MVKDTAAQSPEETAMRNQMAGEVERAMAPLTDREREVLRLRYGLGTDREHTLEEVGRRLFITRERVRQIEAKALAKMRGAGGRAAWYLPPVSKQMVRGALGFQKTVYNRRLWCQCPAYDARHRQHRVRVLEALEQRVKQFIRREELWPLRSPTRAHAARGRGRADAATGFSLV